MVDLSHINHIYLYTNSISFRKGIDSLTNIIYSEMQGCEIDHSLFIFFSNNHKQIKIIEFDDTGTWLYHKKLLKGKFIHPHIEEGNFQIDKRQLEIILENIQITAHKKKH